MEEKNIIEKLEAQEKKIDVIYTKVNRLYKVFLAALIITVVTFVLPLLALIFVIPWALGSIGDMYQGLL